MEVVFPENDFMSGSRQTGRSGRCSGGRSEFCCRDAGDAVAVDGGSGHHGSSFGELKTSIPEVL